MHRRTAAGAVAAVVVLIAVLVVIATSGGGRARVATLAPVIRRTGRPPTGYVVTFRYRAPKAKLVQIEGEWSFSSPQLTTQESSQGLPPLQWKPGDIAISPDAPAEIAAGLKSTWPVAGMTKDRRTGVWSYTIPLPSGVFSYGFLVNCTDAGLTPAELADPNFPVGYTGCPEVADPSNPPWNERHGVTQGSAVTYSRVYVPSDPAFHTTDYWWEAPSSPHGKLTDVTYAGTGGPPNLPGRNYLAIYTPPGYDRHRATPYSTLYLSHGYDADEIDWSMSGDAANILDSLIDKHAIKPMVVVMPNAYWEAPPAPTQSGATVYDENLLGKIIPYVAAHYDVSRQPSQRAFAGLSYGGFVAGTLLLRDTAQFGYFGLFSPAPFAMPAISKAQGAAIRRAGVMVGAGVDDGAYLWAATDIGNLRSAGDRVLVDPVYGGHDWFVWRTLLHTFLTRVAFKPASAAGAAVSSPRGARLAIELPPETQIDRQERKPDRAQRAA